MAKAMSCSYSTMTKSVHYAQEDYALPYGRATAPFVAAERGFIDEVIEPAQTRPKLIRALALLENKHDTNPPNKNGNIRL